MGGETETHGEAKRGASAVAMITGKSDSKGAVSPAGGSRGARHFVLVHGAWCWYKLQDLLEGAGHKVTCLDLACSGNDVSDPASVLTYEDYDRPLLDFMSSLPEGEKVVDSLFGGVGSSRINFRRGCSFPLLLLLLLLLSPGCTGRPQCRRNQRHPYLAQVRQEDLGRSVRGGDHAEVWFHFNGGRQSCNSGSVKVWQGRGHERSERRPQGGIPARKLTYNLSPQDRISTPEIQDRMVKAWPPAAVFSLESDHSPFFSAPAALLDVLIGGVLGLAADD